MRAIQEAAFLVMPSEWYETFGRTTIEAFACGRPVIASRIGPIEELVDAGRTGWIYEPGDADGLARAVEEAVTDPEECARRGTEAREEYRARYGPERNYELLMDTYRHAIHDRKHRTA
jgi:glycosyltransferase involved in cell wall biosynthesis